MEVNSYQRPGSEVNVNQDKNIEGMQDKLKQLDSSNRKFLQQAWANMAEDEEAEQRLLAQLETNPNELQIAVNADDFQIVSRKKGKVKKSPVKSNYSIRGKASHPKPFK